MVATKNDSSNINSPLNTTAALKTPWYQKKPGATRFFLWNLLCWLFAACFLAAGVLYTENIVRPIAESGGFNFNPTQLLKKEESGKRAFGGLDRMNILVLGIDYNHDSKGMIYTKGARSDTMMVVSLSREGDLLNAVSIPRDCRVYLGEEYGYDKINSAYSLGGIEKAEEVVSRFLGVPIHRYLIVKVYGAQKVIDAIGGLPIDVEKDMDYDDNWGGLHIHLKKGLQVLNGEETVGYARFRHDEESDRGRIRRQQQVIRALGSKLKEPSLALRFPEIAERVGQTLETDLKTLDMIDLANLYMGFDFKKMRSATIVGDDAIDGYGASYIEPYAPENEKIVRRLLKSAEWISRADLRVRIYYKAAAPAVANKFADRLADAGFESIDIQALPLNDKRDCGQTYLAWYNKIPRLEGIVKAVVGTFPEKEEAQAAGQDIDLAIVIGDSEEGNLKAMPVGLKQPKPTPRYSSETTRYRDYSPYKEPPVIHNEQATYEDTSDLGEGEDVTIEDYPKASSTDPGLGSDQKPEHTVHSSEEEPLTSQPQAHPHPVPAPNSVEVPAGPAAIPPSSELNPEPPAAEVPIPVATPIESMP